MSPWYSQEQQNNCLSHQTDPFHIIDTSQQEQN